MQTNPSFNILVIGANGGIGRQAVEIALKAGHRVTAVLRNPANLPLTHPNLEVIKGHIMQRETFEKHLENKDVVISTIGGRGRVTGNKSTPLYSHRNANHLQTIKQN